MTEKLLIADDDSDVITSLKYLLSGEDVTVVSEGSPMAVLGRVQKESIDLILMDMNFQRDTTSGTEGLDLVKSLRAEGHLMPILVMTGWASIDLAVDSLKAGANDFIQKPWNDDHLLRALRTHRRLFEAEKQLSRLGRENEILKSNLDNESPRGIVTQSKAMLELMSRLEQLAQSEMSILLTGENGTGKSLLAGYVHEISPRGQGSFVSVNMGAIPEHLFESELFGHVKGAFTDARSDRVGRVELAEGGTLFLDEVANIPLGQQAKLLRVLEEREFEPVGSSRTKNANIRLLSATNADLGGLVEQGAFRQDLLYRLNTVELRVPSLSERTDDIVPLCHFFLQSACRKYGRSEPQLTEASERSLQEYAWPGNVRELAHLMERTLFCIQGDSIEPADLFLQNQEPSRVAGRRVRVSTNETLDEIEARVLKERLSSFDGNVTKTAKSLGLSRSSYYRRVNSQQQRDDEL